MTVFIAGASGATGKLLVDQLLSMGHQVRALVRETATLPDSWETNPQLTLIHGSISEMSPQVLAPYLQGCQGIASCLGHNLTLKGVYGKPRKLVTEALRSLCAAVRILPPEHPMRFVLMNTAGSRNANLRESLSAGEKLLIGLIRHLLPPHTDNEQAAEYLRAEIGAGDPQIEWVVVRPDSLVDHSEVTAYQAFPSPTRSALFNPGKTSRINVGNFMARLLVENELWEQWKGQMPVLYNQS
ncbi:NAD(P)-dependent oxidoreductase [Cyclobacterium jeungdonense]|uniref:SDR family oxidoreductase n=1 Tax=Cyclobacterium jeungdonense TaxID=708087 RepID=A0ABT8C9G7_9BACT|nr:NAD(P)-binding oxidoreductase [Cyclobacterium jeungdonense]MDN3689150.1 SDR family oxidoreductase [Cyclobacterium jeungdonense]